MINKNAPQLDLTIKPALYLRVSTTEQALEGFGLAAQRTKCLAMLTVKGWPAPVEFADEGLSGTLDETRRPGLADLLASIEAGKVNAVVVAALDRVGRSTVLVLRMVELFENAGVDLVSCKESLDTSTPTGRFVLTLFAGLAQLDRDNIVERTTGGRDERGKVDGDKGGRMPMGYLRSEHVTVDPQGAAIVKQIFTRRAAGRTLAAIAEELNLVGQLPRHGARWYASTIREVLLNEELYRGGLRGESPEHWPVIL